MTALHLTVDHTPLGRLTIVCSGDGVVATSFDHDDDGRAAGLSLERVVAAYRASGCGSATSAASARQISRTARREARGYLEGSLRAFSVPPDLALAPPGFARAVLEVVATIPYAELWTYGDVAGLADSPRAARAAGSALAGCPIELFVPCHRVVHASGTLGGYGRHEERKRWLLRHEGVIG